MSVQDSSYDLSEVVKLKFGEAGFVDPLKFSLSKELPSVLNAFLTERQLELSEEDRAVVGFAKIYQSLQKPPDLAWGHVAFPCFQLAKLLKKAPPALGVELAQHFSKDAQLFKEMLAKLEAKGPFINFYFKPEFLFAVLNENISASRLLLLRDAPKTMVEFSQPNTHKELHVGHMRNACLGDSIVRTLRYAGVEVITSTFPGDMGTHVAKCLWYLKNKSQDAAPVEDVARGLVGDELKIQRGEWLGRMYSRASLLLEDELGTDREERNRQELTEILKQLEQKAGPYYELWMETRAWSIDLFHVVYAWCDIEFDCWYWESEVDSESVRWVRELYEAGRLVESEGAIGMDLSADSLGFCLLLKSDGNGLYATKDLLLAKKKFEDFKIQKSVYVVDQRQSLHFKQVFRVLELLGFREAAGCYHLPYNFVELPDGAMSSRKGNIVPLIQLIRRMEGKIRDDYLSRFVGEWTEEEIKETSRRIAQAAIKYGMVKMDANKKIVFKMEDWLKLDGDSGPYILYAYARIRSLLRKFSSSFGVSPSLGFSVGGLLTSKEELGLMVKLTEFLDVVRLAAEEMRPQLIGNYLYELAQGFSAFYAAHPIGQVEDGGLREARLVLSERVGFVLKRGLELLGITAVEKM